MSFFNQYSTIINFEELPEPLQTWELDDRIGEGTYGEVFGAKNRKTAEIVAVKIMEAIHEVVEEIEEEYRILKELGGRCNIPRFHGIYLKRNDKPSDVQLWLAMELCGGGSVTDLAKSEIKAERRLSEQVIAHLIRETIDGLVHLHKNKVMHRDVKGHNILLTNDAEVRLVDFGVSGHLKTTHGRRNTSVGTPYWMAPEVVACEQQIEYEYDYRCDTWSLGITAIELADGEPPLTDLHPMRALFRIPRNPPPSVKNESDWSPEFIDFIKTCLIKDFERRPFVKDLYDHPFIKNSISSKQMVVIEIKEMMSCMGRVFHEPDTTTKHGRLKSKRKSKKNCPNAFDDLAMLQELNEDIIVTHLRNRFKETLIYTYIGDILLAVNPFRPLTIYSDEYSKMYQHASKNENSPHIFAIADQSFQTMVHNNQSQCIVISGESGSGKTQNANYIIQQLTQLGKADNRTLEDRILQVNPLMEAFGNARTNINDNSSRFGKYLEMTFTASGKVTGARLSEYLLEKTRVINQSHGERNFHIMYYIHAYLSYEDVANVYKIRDYDQYRFIKDADLTTVEVNINKVKFKAIQHGFQIIGFKPQELNSVYSILAAILHIGNIKFRVKESKFANAGSTVTNVEVIQTVANLLGINGDDLVEALTTAGLVARGETIVRNNTVQEAANARDAMAKALYGRIFSWIVYKINLLLKPPKARQDDECTTIGILDIFGFENFVKNSFEQLCINIANEQIQYYFNEHIFAWELQEYKNEGVDGSNIEFTDNRPVLDMFLLKPLGLLALLDEESHFPKATDHTLVAKFHKNIKNKHYSRPRVDRPMFIIQHYAGSVQYDVNGFLEKNRDRLAPEIVQLLRMSDNPLLRTLFQNPITKTGSVAYSSLNNSASSSTCSSNITSPGSTVASSTFTLSVGTQRSNSSYASQSRCTQTVATYFRYSLMDLLSKMVTGTPHFVRCFRPNSENAPCKFDDAKVMAQLRYTGVLETTRIRRQGYSHRLSFSEFIKRYYILGFSVTSTVAVTKENCVSLLKKLSLKNWAVGKTKVFLKYYHIEELSQKYEEMKNKIIVVQSYVRMWLAVRHFMVMKERIYSSVPVIQKHIRGFLARKQYSAMKKKELSAVRIQSAMRGFAERRKYLAVRQMYHENATVIQAAWRGKKGRQLLQVRQKEVDKMKHTAKLHKAVLVLQKNFRMWRTRSIYQHLCMYKCQKETQAMYFGKQVELYANGLHNVMVNNNNTGNEEIEQIPVKAGSANSQTNTQNRSNLRKWREAKTPWTKEDANYYNKIIADNSAFKRPSEKNSKTAASPIENGYYDRIALTPNAMPRIWNYNYLPDSAGESDGEGRVLHNYQEVSDLYRTIIAQTAASKFIANQPVYQQRKMTKSGSDQSLPWDAPLRSAQKNASGLPKRVSSRAFPPGAVTQIELLDQEAKL
ncbi:myosin-IIIb-like [Tubulanus polymorphus]|uniref:myosin-IIIb-like n=1 Tax=Tubulanus polymorphus TaxID=672921 RepID=UPI003DA46893